MGAIVRDGVKLAYNENVGTIVRDGVKLAYGETGVGEPAVLLIHGWCCDRTYFEPQVEFLRHAHRVICPDLRGHGESDAPQQRYHPDDFVDDLVALLDHLGVRRPIVVGHSMGAIVALRLAAAIPDDVSAVVGLDGAWGSVAPAILASVGASLEGLSGPDHEATMREMCEGFFLPTDDPELRRRIVEGMAAAPRHVRTSAFYESFERTDTRPDLHTLSVPALYVASERPVVDLDELRAAGVTVGQTIGSGHFHQLECPAQVNAMLWRFLSCHGLTALPTPSLVSGRG